MSTDISQIVHWHDDKVEGQPRHPAKMKASFMNTEEPQYDQKQSNCFFSPSPLFGRARILTFTTTAIVCFKQRLLDHLQEIMIRSNKLYD